ncbi:hypothetical protein BDZ45DRAFT_736726 [Acephala macrosclerotiorum]|nr:hypothetical protein BDZ45DRAFT_736726 [Acephala macrosclerotiorum]
MASDRVRKAAQEHVERVGLNFLVSSQPFLSFVFCCTSQVGPFWKLSFWGYSVTIHTSMPSMRVDDDMGVVGEVDDDVLVDLVAAVRKAREVRASGKAQAQTFGFSADVLAAKRAVEVERVRRRKLVPVRSAMRRQGGRGVHVHWANSPMPDGYLVVDVRYTDPVGLGNPTASLQLASWPDEKAEWLVWEGKLVRKDGIYWGPSFVGDFGADGPFVCQRCSRLH